MNPNQPPFIVDVSSDNLNTSFPKDNFKRNASMPTLRKALSLENTESPTHQVYITKKQLKIRNHYKQSLFKDALNYERSIIPSIYFSVTLYTLWGTLWTLIYKFTSFNNWAVNPLIITILGVVMGLLLAFRTNTAYDRFWEARKIWGVLFTASRNLTRFVWIGSKSSSPEEVNEQRCGINLIIAFSYATKRFLRGEHGMLHGDMTNLLSHLNIPVSDDEPEAFKSMMAQTDNLPLEISFQLSSLIQSLRARGIFYLKKELVDVPTGSAMIAALSSLIDCLSNLERIRNCPIPHAYSLHLTLIFANSSQTLMLYLATLPFQLVAIMGYATIAVVFISSFTLLGILAISGEIENPFGYSPI